MSAKTWIKLRRGLILDPKHRVKLGINLWLYLYILDKADWNTGKIFSWQDQLVADDLQMPLTTVRYQRRKLEEEGYITSMVKGYSQIITVTKWSNPRQSDNGLTPSLINSGARVEREFRESDQNLTPLHLINISHITDHNNDKESDNLLTLSEKSYFNIWMDKTNIKINDLQKFKDLIRVFERANVSPDIFSLAIDQMYEKNYKVIQPTSTETWAIGLARQINKKHNPKKGSYEYWSQWVKDHPVELTTTTEEGDQIANI